MLRMMARRTFALQVDEQADRVMFGITLPGGTIVHGVKAEVSWVCGTLAGVVNLFQLTEAIGVAAEGYVIPLDDPDSVPTYDSLWNRYVPKDSDADGLDTDTVTEDSSVFWEPGEMSMVNIFDVGNRPKRVYHMHKIATSVRDNMWSGQKIAVPADDPVWLPGGSFSPGIRRPIRVSRPSILMYAMGLPTMDDTTTQVPKSLGEEAIPLVKYMQDTLEDAFKDQLQGLTGDPWDKATQVLRSHMNPDVFEQTAGAFTIPGQISVIGEASIDHSVVGQLRIRSVSTGR